MGHNMVDGYVLLVLIFGFSALFEGVSYYFLVESGLPEYPYALGFTERPCMWRWMEYAVTSPLQILLIASSLMIRDVYTLYMLVFAQVALVQLGFAVEYAISEKGDKCKGTLQAGDVFGLDYPGMQWETLPLHFNKQATTAVKDDEKNDADVSQKELPNPCNIDRLFWFSFSPAWLLHGAIWGILIQYFSSQDVDCDNQAMDWKAMLTAVVVTQGVGFTAFAVIPLFQALKVGILPSWLNFTFCFPSWFRLKIPTDEEKEKEGAAVLHWAFGYYTWLSLLVKVTLGITYMSFVTFFPFTTRDV
jgi:hypothetical protein